MPSKAATATVQQSMLHIRCCCCHHKNRLYGT